MLQVQTPPSPPHKNCCVRGTCYLATPATAPWAELHRQKRQGSLSKNVDIQLATHTTRLSCRDCQHSPPAPGPEGGERGPRGATEEEALPLGAKNCRGSPGGSPPQTSPAGARLPRLLWLLWPLAVRPPLTTDKTTHRVRVLGSWQPSPCGTLPHLTLETALRGHPPPSDRCEH